MPARDLELWKTDPDSAHSANIGLLVSKKTPKRIVDDYAKQLAGQSAEACIADYLNCNKYDLGGRIGEIRATALVAAWRRRNVDRGFAADPRQCHEHDLRDNTCRGPRRNDRATRLAERGHWGLSCHPVLTTDRRLANCPGGSDDTHTGKWKTSLLRIPS